MSEVSIIGLDIAKGNVPTAVEIGGAALLALSC